MDHLSVSSELDSSKRRSSSRFLSKSVQRGLRQLKKDEHDLRVAHLVKKNATFYRRQKICETFTTFMIILIFTRKKQYTSFLIVNISDLRLLTTKVTKQCKSLT